MRKKRKKTVKVNLAGKRAAEPTCRHQLNQQRGYRFPIFHAIVSPVFLGRLKHFCVVSNNSSGLISYLTLHENSGPLLKF